MMRQMFINLPVESLANSTPFYTALGFRINPLFSDESQQCFVWSDAVYVMLQTSSFFTRMRNLTKQILPIAHHTHCLSRKPLK